MLAIVYPHYADGVAKLDKIEIDCTTDGVDVVKPGTEALGTEYFTIDDGFTNFKTLNGDLIQPYTFCSIHPTFTVIDWEKAKPIMADFIKKTRARKVGVFIMDGLWSVIN